MKSKPPSPSDPLARLNQEYHAALERTDLTGAIELLGKLRRLTPADPGVLLQLGWLHGRAHDSAAAMQAFEAAWQLAPAERQAEVLAAAAALARGFYAPDVAEHLFRRAVEQPKARAETLANFAEFCERCRKMDEAQRWVEQALTRDTHCEPALLMRARLEARAGRLETAESELRGLLHRTRAAEIRIRAGSELGVVLDRQARYDEAMEAFGQAKALLRPLAEQQVVPRQRTRDHLAQMRAEINPALLKRWAESAGRLETPPRKLALLGGHPRSGTTLLEQVLDAHPDITSIEETAHFAELVYHPLQQRWPAGTPMLKLLDATPTALIDTYRNRYLDAADRCLGNPVGDRLLVDKNPALTVMAPALARVFPEMKFLIMLRDPRDVVLSCFLQPVLSVERVHYPYLSLATTAEGYAGLMQTWRTVAPMLPNPQLELRYEDMVEDLDAVARKALDFLGVPWDERVLRYDEHAQQKLVRSPTYADVTQKVFKRARGRWRNYRKYLEPHLPVLEPFVKAFGYE